MVRKYWGASLCRNGFLVVGGHKKKAPEEPKFPQGRKPGYIRDGRSAAVFSCIDSLP